MVIALKGRAWMSHPAVGKARSSQPSSTLNSQLSTLNFSTLGGLSIELIVATAILLGALLPLAYSIVTEKRFARAAYQHAVAMEIVDGAHVQSLDAYRPERFW